MGLRSHSVTEMFDRCRDAVTAAIAPAYDGGALSGDVIAGSHRV